MDKVRLNSDYYWWSFCCISFNYTLPVPLQLTVTGRDLGSPSRAATNTATVIVSVFRNNNAPQFIQTPYITTVDKNTVDNSNIFTVSAVDADTRVSHCEKYSAMSIILQFFFFSNSLTWVHVNCDCFYHILIGSIQHIDSVCDWRWQCSFPLLPDPEWKQWCHSSSVQSELGVWYCQLLQGNVYSVFSTPRYIWMLMN